MATAEQTVAALRTDRQARAALGIAADAIRRGYDVINTIEPSTLTEIFLAPLGLVESTTDAEVREQATDLLDRTNLYAEGIYAMIPNDDTILDDTTRGQVATALTQATSDLALLVSVRNDIVTSFEDDLESLLQAILSATADAAAYIAKKANQLAGILLPTWAKWAIGIGVVAGVAGLIWKYSK